jgi:ribokinase
MGGVVVLGSINIDLLVHVPRLPQPGETVLGSRLVRAHGGKGANQAVAAARLGAAVRFIGRVGADPFGLELVAGLIEDGIDVAGVAQDPSEPSGAALIVVEEGGQNQITVAPGANATVGRAEVEVMSKDLRPDDVVVLQLEIPRATVHAAIEAGRAAGARVILNAAPRPLAVDPMLPPVDFLVANETEARSLGEAPAAGALVVTLGAMGARVVDAGVSTTIASHRVEAIDATGAGDAFVGAFAFALTRGSDVLEAAKLGCAAGAASVTKLGARPSLPRPEDLERLFGIGIR